MKAAAHLDPERGEMRIAYIMSRYPHLPETFILREMVEMDRLGWDVSVYPLIKQRPFLVHEEVKRFSGSVRNVPFLSLQMASANLACFLRKPQQYLRVLWNVFAGNFHSLQFFLRSFVIFPAAVWMAKDMETRGIVHVHAHYATHPALAAWIIYQLTGIRYTATVHAHDIFVNRTMLSEKVKGAEHVITISDFNRRFLASELGEWVLEKSTTIHCGIDPELYTHNLELQAGRPFTVLSIGSLQEYKGQKHLVEACRLLKEMDFQFQCVIIGGGELHDFLQKQIVVAGLEGMVELAGPKTQSEVARYLARADCYVQPSVITDTGKMEGIPVSLMEAMASGVPVIATGISGIPELVRDGDTGILVPEGNSQALAAAITRLASDSEFRVRLVQNAGVLVAEEFRLSRNVQDLSELIRSLNKPCEKSQPSQPGQSSMSTDGAV